MQSEISLEGGEFELSCGVTKRCELDLANDDELRSSARRLYAHRATDGPEVFKRRQMAYGFTYSPYSLLVDADLTGIIQPASQYMHDWMHGVFVGGVWSVTVNYILEALRVDGIADLYQMILDYVAMWTFPARTKQSKAHEIFEPKRRRGNVKARYFKCKASEGLSVYAILAHFLQRCVIPAGRCVALCTTYLALADMIDFLLAASRYEHGFVQPHQLTAAIEHFYALYKAHIGLKLTTPKFHWTLHYPDALYQWKTLLSCFVHERKHKTILRFGTDIYNTTAFEKSVLHEVTCQQLAALDDTAVCDFSVGLIQPRPATKKLKNFVIDALDLHVVRNLLTINMALHARFSQAGVCSARDVVLVRDDRDGAVKAAGQIWAHLSVEGECISIVTMWDLIDFDRRQGSASWRLQHVPELIKLSSIIEVVVWAESDGVIRTLIPRYFC